MQYSAELFSDEILTLSRDIISRKDRKYKASYHIPLLLKIYSTGGTQAMFCTEAGIHRSTFNRWLKECHEFGNSYCIAQERARAFHENLARDALLTNTPNFNATLWSMVARNRYGYTADRKLHIPDIKDVTDLNSMLKVIFNQISEGKITATEANVLATMISSTIKVDAHTTEKTTLEEIHSMLKMHEGK